MSSRQSLSDAKIPKYIPEGFVGADFADDFAEMVEGFAEVLGYQVRREGGDMEAGAGHDQERMRRRTRAS